MYPEIDKNKCTECGTCLNECTECVFDEDEEGIAVTYPENCDECGDCITGCPEGAISLK